MRDSALSLSETMNRAIATLQQGKLAEAEQLCNGIVARNPGFVEALHLLAVVQSSSGRLDDALATYDRALVLRPNYVEALCDRGVTLHQAGRFEAALASYDRALALRAGFAAALYNRGITLFELKRFDAALASYDGALALRPDHAEALSNRGTALKALKRGDEALASYQRALALRPNLADALHNQGVLLYEQRRLDEALASFNRALSARPDLADALHYRGNILKELGRPEEALASYDRAVALRPLNTEALSNRGFILHGLGRFEEAISSYDKALAISPADADIRFNRGTALAALLRLDEALASFDHALRLRPHMVEALNARGNALYELNRSEDAHAVTLGRFKAALASYDQAVAISPDYAEAYSNRAATLHEIGDFEASRASYAKAVALKPDFAAAQFGLCMAQLLPIYAAETEVLERRAAYAQQLRALCAGSAHATSSMDLAKAVGLSQPFLLAYQGYNDRDLQALYGSFLCRIMAERYPPVTLAPPPLPSEKLRIGIVSGYFRQHSNWKVPIRGWLTQLDRGQFRIFGYHTGPDQDGETKAAAALCERFVQGPLTLDRWRAEILADTPHVVIYPEIGMDRVAVALAAQRLAAVQCNSWGHPETSGLPTLDYYLSSDLMEPPDAADHYTERLVRLPNLSVYCEPAQRPSVPMARGDFGLRAGATAFWCGQSLFKYLPRFDEVFPRIALGAGDCQFVFIEHQKSARVTALFRQRLERAFGAFGLAADAHCVFLPRQNPQEFAAATGLCDVFLDSIGWSGCNSTLDSLPCDLPIVTFAGPLMRGRHGLAILRRMGITETIAESSEDDYVSAAVRLARDLPWREAVKAKVAAGKHRIYYDKECIAGLEQFLNRAGRKIPAP
jgi:protein O-GlcNAc transferase